MFLPVHCQKGLRPFREATQSLFKSHGVDFPPLRGGLREAGQIVVVVALLQLPAMQAALGGGVVQQLVVHVEPGEGAALDALVLHAEIYLAIIAVGGVPVQMAVLVLEDVAQVAAVRQYLSAVVQQVAQAGEQVGQALQRARHAQSVHQQQDGVEAFRPVGLHDVALVHVGYAALAHHLAREGGDVHRRHLQSALLQGQGVAACACAHVQHAAVAEVHGAPFQHGHMVIGAEEVGHG